MELISKVGREKKKNFVRQQNNCKYEWETNRREKTRKGQGRTLKTPYLPATKKGVYSLLEGKR